MHNRNSFLVRRLRLSAGLSARLQFAVFVRFWAVTFAVILWGAAVSPATAQDVDGDLIPDLEDNCVDRANPDQRNSDFDRFGDLCDGDMNNDGTTDATDRTLIEGQVTSAEPLRVADLNSDGAVDAGDLAYFDTELVNLPPGAAGAQAHDADGNGILDFCSPPAAHGTFPNEWNPTQHPDLVTNGSLASANGIEPDGWDPHDFSRVAYRENIASVGAYQWLGFSGVGGNVAGLCYNACVAPPPIAVSADRTYNFSFESCAPEFPPSNFWIVFDEYDATGALLGSTGPLVASKAMPSGTGVWEETSVFYTPSSNDVASTRPKLTKKIGPANAKSVFFAKDFSFWELDAEGTRTYRSPPATKQPFSGARTRVDTLGNVEVFDLVLGQWEPFFPIGIYGTWERGDFSFYTDMGFNLFMNDRGVNLSAPRAVAAGMRFMLSTGGLWDAAKYPNFSQMIGLNAQALNPVGQSVPVYDSLFGFMFDNENFSQCVTETGSSSCTAPYTSPWNGAVDPQPGVAPLGPLQELYAFDRGMNGGARGVPHYYLNGNPNVARAYFGDVVNAEGDRRMDITGSYAVSSFEQVQQSENQAAPGVFIQLQAHLARRVLPTAWAGIARGARGIASWRDRPVSPFFNRAPTLRICGTNLPVLQVRGTLANPVSGSVVEGAISQAQAEILTDRGEFAGCGGGAVGRSYFIKLQPNAGVESFFSVGESICDVANPSCDANVAEVIAPYEVVHIGSLDQYEWTDQLPDFRDDVNALASVIAADHKTTWKANCRATLANVSGNPAVSFGDNGIVCGGRTVGNTAYLILSNTYFKIDPFAPYLEQHTGEALTVDVTLSNLTFPVEERRMFDFNTHTFEAAGAMVVGDQFSVTIPPLGFAVISLPEPISAVGLGFGLAALVALHRRREVDGRDGRG